MSDEHKDTVEPQEAVHDEAGNTADQELPHEEDLDPIKALVARSEADPGAPFEPESLAVLWELRESDRAEFIRVRKRLKELDVPVGQLDRAIDAYAKDALEAAVAEMDAEQAHLEVDPEEDDDPRPVIKLFHHGLSSAIDEASALLKAVSVNESAPLSSRIFVRAGALVVIRQGNDAADQTQEAEVAPSDSIQICRIRHSVLIRERLDQISRWREETKDGMRTAHPPEIVAQTILEGRRNFPPLEALLSAPTLRRDGTLLEDEGYDAKTGWFVCFGGVRFGSINQSPTREECQRALDVLLEPFQGFPCASDADFAALAAMLLTAVVRRSLEIAPFIGIDSPIAGTGKTLLARCAGILATGFEPALLAPPDREEELHKGVGAALMAGVAVLLLDNIEGPLRSPTLCAMLTAPRAKFRILGLSELADVPTDALLIATGNGLTPLGDLATRCSMIRLDAREEDPTSRSFPRPATTEVLERRPELLVAALTVLRGGIRANASEIPAYRPTRFADWDRLVRRTLLWLGLDDPAKTLFRARESDPERENAAALFLAWAEVFEDRFTTAAELLASPPLRDVLACVLGRPIGEPAAVQALGIWLRKRIGFRAAGFVLEHRPARKTEYRLATERCTTSPPCTTYRPTRGGEGEDDEEGVREESISTSVSPHTHKAPRVVQSPEVVQAEGDDRPPTSSAAGAEPLPGLPGDAEAELRAIADAYCVGMDAP